MPGSRQLVKVDPILASTFDKYIYNALKQKKNLLFFENTKNYQTSISAFHSRSLAFTLVFRSQIC